MPGQFKKEQQVSLPPAEFSNAIHFIYGNEFDFRTWPQSREWRLFNAGKAAACSDAAAELAAMFKEAKDKSRTGG